MSIFTTFTTTSRFYKVKIMRTSYTTIHFVSCDMIFKTHKYKSDQEYMTQDYLILKINLKQVAVRVNFNKADKN